MNRLSVLAASLIGLAAISATSAAALAETIKVTIKDLAFSPATVTAHVGDVIEWTNADFIDHTATAAKGEFDVMIRANQTARITVTKAGGIDYICAFHPNMTGAVQVLPK
jgi:plastocyanin